MTVMFPENLGIVCPKGLEFMYDEHAVSLGDGQPVVTWYPQYPMSAWELHSFMKGKVPQHCKDLQKKYPNLFAAHEREAFNRFLGGRKVYKMPKGFI